MGSCWGIDAIIISMQSLRNAHRLTRLVLVWFALFIGVAVASPLIKSNSTQLVCTAIGGMKLVQVDAEGGSDTAAHASLECPSCLPFTAPPPASSEDLLCAGSLTQVLRPKHLALLHNLLGQPWQARAPPFFYA